MEKVESLVKNIFNIKPNNINLFNQAFTHRSYLNETKEKNLKSYERLEFLGDSVLSIIVSEIIYEKFPNLPEGDLTNLRSVIVKTESLAELAKNFGLGSYLYLSRGEENEGGRNNPSILADCMEALIAALFLDQGIENTKKAISFYLLSAIDNYYPKKELKDYKSLLQEYSQEKFLVSPVYRVIKAEGPDHKKLFTIRVNIKEKSYGLGRGFSKQKAEMEAAKQALEKLTN